MVPDGVRNVRVRTLPSTAASWSPRLLETRGKGPVAQNLDLLNGNLCVGRIDDWRGRLKVRHR